MNKSMINAALVVAFGVSALSAQAATLNNGDSLSLTAGVIAYGTQNNYDANGNVTSTSTVQTNVTKSWFGMDTNGDATIAGSEKTALSQGTTGLVIGVATTQGSSHSGMPTAGDSNAITAPWGFFGNTGSDYTTVGITGGTTGMNMSGWTVTWNGIASIPMGSGAWGTGFSNGVGNLTWNGVYGSTYKLDYHATVPLGDASGFGGVKYALHLEGVVTAAPVSQVPVPAAAWLLGSGLVGLVGVARRKQKA